MALPQNPYGRRWRALRGRFLSEHPTCRMCEAQGRTEPARVVDHVRPWRSGATEQEQERLFWDVSNLQGLCQTDHDASKQAQEKNGHLRGSDLQGYPLDKAAHPWFRGSDE